MKRSLITIIALSAFLLVIGSMTAYSQNQADGIGGIPKRELTKAEEKALKKRQREMADSIEHVKALNALLEGEYVMECEDVTFKRGKRVVVNSGTNFVACHDGVVTIQVSPFVSGGPNGVGGITVEGAPSALEIDTDKKGNTHLTMNVTGVGVSARVSITLYKYDNTATALVSPNMHSFNVNLRGRIVRSEDSAVYKGTAF